MTKRNLTWLRQHTNVEDLLDDRIENNSDLKSFCPPAEPCDEPPVTELPEVQLEQVQAKPPMPERAQPDFFVAAIGTLMVGCGLSLVLHPVDLVVYHDRAKYFRRDFLEHVGHGRSEIYGAAGVLLGIALLIYSFYRPRK